MPKKIVCLGLAAILLAGNTGCCLIRRLCQRFDERHWCCSGCGEVYWGEWFGDPPDCEDPCDNCGAWVGGLHPHRRDSATLPIEASRETTLDEWIAAEPAEPAEPEEAQKEPRER